MKKTLIFIVASLLFQVSLVAQDVIILRDGTEENGKAEMVSNGLLTYNVYGQQKQVKTNQLYLVKYQTRGNVFFTQEGESFYNTESNYSKVSKKSIFIYLTEGAEIIASEVNVTTDKVRYKLPKKGAISAIKNIFNKDKEAEWVDIEKERVFFIKHVDGSKDVITDLRKIDEQARIDALPKCKHPFVPINNDSSFPCPGEMTMNDGSSIEVIIYDLDREYVHYRTKEWQDGPIFRMKRSKINKIQH